MAEQPLRAPTFEAVVLREEIGPLRLVADEHAIKSFAFAVDDYTAEYFADASALGPRLAPSMMVAKELVTLFLTRYDPNALVGLHAREEIWLEAPVFTGAQLTLTGRYVDKYVKRGKGYVVLESEARDEQGRVVVRQRSVEIMRVPDSIQLGASSARVESSDRRVAAKWPTDRAPVSRVTADVTPGTPIGPLVKQVHQDQMCVFSGAGKHWRNVHNTLEIARGAGFPTTLAQGMMEACWLSELLYGAVGPAWLRSGRMSLVFLQPVYPGDVVTSRGTVSDVQRRPDGDALELEIWCDKPGTAPTAAGFAHVVLRE